jgi:hypothetical protein
VRQGYSFGVFLQDNWKPTDWLTLIPGMRVDWGLARNSLGETTHNLMGVGPRIGASIDLTRDGKTLWKVAYGRSNEVATLRIAQLADAGAAQQTYEWSRTTGRCDRFVSSQGGDRGYDLSGRCGDGTVSLACGNARLSGSPPRADFFTTTLERAVTQGVAVSVAYTYRLLSFLWEDIEVNARRRLDGGDFSAFGDERLGGVKAYRPMKEAFRQYSGLDFVLSGTPSPNWQFFVAYTLSFLDGTGDDQLSVLGNDPPRDFRLRGYLADDHRHQLKANGSYAFRGLTVGVNLSFMTGSPATRLYLQPLGYTGRYGWRGVDPGADPNDLRKWTELRSPDLLDVSVRAQYDFYGLLHQHLAVVVDLFNALDLATPGNRGANTTNQAGFEARNSAAYGAVTGRLVPFRAQFGLRYQF